ncbi:MAG: hypothetical protein ACK51L_04340 [bacterium]
MLLPAPASGERERGYEIAGREIFLAPAKPPGERGQQRRERVPAKAPVERRQQAEQAATVPVPV